MSWRNTNTHTNKQSNMNSGSRFDKFFKKKNTQETNTTDSGKRFVNKTYDRDFSEPATDTNSYHGGFDPTKPRKQYQNKPRNDNICRSFAANGNCRFGTKCRFKHVAPEPKVVAKPLNEMDQLTKRIKEITTLLESGRFMPKNKQDELKAELEECMEKKKNQFPTLGGAAVASKAIPDFSSKLSGSCWGNVSSKVKSTEGVVESNKAARANRIRMEAEKKREQKKVYDEHVESDFEGDDFFSEEEEDFYDEDYDEDEYYEDL